MRVLVTGRDGQVARSLAARSGSSELVTTVGRPDLDITDPDRVRRVIDEFEPTVIVNAAAYTAVDRAETDPDSAFAVNRDGAANVAHAAAEIGVPVIHISTDYVFPGDRTGFWRESDPTGPLGVYGLSKLAGEDAVREANASHVILRTAWVYSPFGQNFLRTMLRLAAERDVVRVVGDQRGSPTYAPDIAEGILAVGRRLAAGGNEAFGTFHMTARGETDWAGFAEEIFAASAARGGASARVERIGTADYPTPARRPANSVLDTSLFEATFGHRLPEWSRSIPICLEALGLRPPEKA